MTEKVIQAYGLTSYWVETAEDRIRLRVGEHNPSLDEMLLRFGVTEWAYVTAYNPGSVKFSFRENEERQNRLIEEVNAKGYRTLAGEGVGDVGDWPPERSILILGIPLEEAQRVGTEYGQTAILVGRLYEPPRLLLC